MSNKEVRTEIRITLGRERERVKYIPVDKIQYMQSEDKCVLIYYEKASAVSCESLVSFEKEFGGKFLRINRGILVAKEFIEGVVRSSNSTTYGIRTKGGVVLPISRRHKTSVIETVQNLELN